MQEHMNRFHETFIKMATEYTEHVRREMATANKKANEVNTLRAGEIISFGPAPVTITDEVRTVNLLAATVNRMNNQNNIARFEAELSKVQRPGIDKLLDYIRKSDFYSAPASAKYHLACPGGLLQHSLNVLDALRSILVWNKEHGNWDYMAAGKVVDTIPGDGVTIMALLHDICKTYFYGTSARNQKNEATGRWEKVPFYTVADMMPLGHGPKSAMMVKQYTTLTNQELYAIWHHMGFNGNYENDNAVGKSIEMYPAVLALQTADMMASRFMEDEKGNVDLFADAPPPVSAPGINGEWAGSQGAEGLTFEEAAPLGGEG